MMSALFRRTGGNADSASRSPNNARGFTLVELMTVLAVVAILLVIAVPSYSVLSLRTKLKSYANELVASVYLARGEAIKRNAPITMCLSADGTTCAAGGDWDQGWIVIDQDDVVLRHQQAPQAGIKIFELSSVFAMTFQPSGVQNTPVTMTVCQDSPEGIEEREVTISTTGRHTIKTTKAGCSP